MLLNQPTSGQPSQPQAQGVTDPNNQETFQQRMRRLSGQANSAAAGIPQQGQQVSPYAGQATKMGAFSRTQAGQPQLQAAGRTFNQNAAMATPVSGDGSIPPPSPTPQYQPQFQQMNETFQGSPQIASSRAAQPAPSGIATTAQPPAPSPATQAAPQFSSGAGTQGASLTGLAPGWQDAGNGMVRNPQTGQLLPQNNPTYQTLLQQNGAAPAGGASGGGAGAQYPTQLGQFTLDTPNAPNYTATDFGNVPNPQGYAGTTFSQFAAPDQTATNAGQANLTAAILGNPESMDPNTVAAMQNANKETALMQQKQAAMGIGASAAARGLAGGGSEMGDLMRLQGTTDSNILAGNRDIATQAAQTNFNNRLAALSGTSAANAQAAATAEGLYNTRLGGEQTQASDKLAAVNSALNAAGFGLSKDQATAANNLQNYNVGRQNQQDVQQRQLSQFGINQAIAGQNLADRTQSQGNATANRSLDIQDALGRMGINLNQQQINNQASQFGQNYGLNIADLLERAREANNNLGYNYSALNTSGQNNMMQQIQQILNGGG